MSRRLSRRTFIATIAVTGGTLAAAAWFRGARRSRRPPSAPPDLWVQVDADSKVTVHVHKVEMGQGVLTALAMLIVEELGVEWPEVRVTQASADRRFGDQDTSGSTSMADSWKRLRAVGAAMRMMFVQAAAGRWTVPPSECASAGTVIEHPRSGRRATMGELIPDLAHLAPPDLDNVPLKPRTAWRLIGKPTRRVDAPAKVAGRLGYGIDVRLPRMLYAATLRCPVQGGTVKRMDPEPALAVSGVRRVISLDPVPRARLPERIAVVADSTWAAFQGRRALQIDWDEGPHRSLSSDGMQVRLLAADALQPIVDRNDGDALAAGVLAPSAVTATYQVPYLAHSTMEPMNCTAHAVDGGMEIWAPTQFPIRAMDHVVRLTGLPQSAIRLHLTAMGGGFGRRVYPDFVVEAVQVARAVDAPVQVVWSREDDLRQDFYRGPSVHRMFAVPDDDGRPRAWLHRLAGPSIVRSVWPPWSGEPNSRLPPSASEIGGAVSLPYAIPNVRVEYRFVDLPVPLGVWRSVAQSPNIFAVESFIDELAHRAGADPVIYRRGLLDGHPRLRRVLDLAAERSGWGTPLPARQGRGIALTTYGNTFVAHVAEVTVDSTGTIRVRRVTCAADCGIVINPLGAAAQVEGGIVWGLSAALKGRITVRDGRIEQSNFHDYPLLRFSEMPRVDVHLVESDEPPDGFGEPTVDPVAPAVANAVFAAVGVRLRTMPLQLGTGAAR
jgi:isoquinoline 1-oxidoreductase beta subunit